MMKDRASPYFADLDPDSGAILNSQALGLRTTGVGTALAVAVTLHALLRKRRVSVAVAWVGLAWLSPIFGSVLYLMFGINRVTRRARRLRTITRLETAAWSSSSTRSTATCG